MTAEIKQRIRGQISLSAPEIVMKHLPSLSLINAERLTGTLFGIYGNAGALSGVIRTSLEGDATSKRGVVSEDLWGDWTYITGDITNIKGLATGVVGDATGKSGDISGIYGDFSKCRGDISGVCGYVNGLEGDFTGIVATTDEIKEALKGGF